MIQKLTVKFYTYSVKTLRVELADFWSMNFSQSVLGDGPAVTRRQDSRPACYLNGAVYVARTDWLLEHRSFVGDGTVASEMPACRAVDIDGPEDLEYAGFLLGNSASS